MNNRATDPMLDMIVIMNLIGRIAPPTAEDSSTDELLVKSPIFMVS
jgi:hypothetical protein